MCDLYIYFSPALDSHGFPYFQTEKQGWDISSLFIDLFYDFIRSNLFSHSSLINRFDLSVVWPLIPCTQHMYITCLSELTTAPLSLFVSTGPEQIVVVSENVEALQTTATEDTVYSCAAQNNAGNRLTWGKFGAY